MAVISISSPSGRQAGGGFRTSYRCWQNQTMGKHSYCTANRTAQLPLKGPSRRQKRWNSEVSLEPTSRPRARHLEAFFLPLAFFFSFLGSQTMLTTVPDLVTSRVRALWPEEDSVSGLPASYSCSKAGPPILGSTRSPLPKFHLPTPPCRPAAASSALTCQGDCRQAQTHTIWECHPCRCLPPS